MSRNLSVRSCHARGFTLVEALVALLVLSIGLLGVASMQLKALQSAHVGYQRSIASLAAQDAQERLWAQLAEEAMTCPSWSDAKDLGGASWYDTWSGYLPGLVQDSVTPSTTPNADCAFDISVEWSESRFGGESDPVFSYKARLPGSQP